MPATVLPSRVLYTLDDFLLLSLFFAAVHMLQSGDEEELFFYMKYSFPGQEPGGVDKAVPPTSAVT